MKNVAKIPPVACRKMTLLNTRRCAFEPLLRIARYPPSSPLHTDCMNSTSSVVPIYLSVLELMGKCVNPTIFCHSSDQPFRFSGFINALNFAVVPHRTFSGPSIDIPGSSVEQISKTLETFYIGEVSYFNISKFL